MNPDSERALNGLRAFLLLDLKSFSRDVHVATTRRFEA